MAFHPLTDQVESLLSPAPRCRGWPCLVAHTHHLSNHIACLACRQHPRRS
jgi:hypothetical protein